MANPNIVEVTTINGKSMGYNISSANGIMVPPESAIAATGVPTGHVYKINSITVSNISTGTTAWVSVWRATGGVAGPYGTTSFSGYLAYQIDVPPKASISILGKSTSIYLNESHKIAASTSVAAGTLVFNCSYEDIS
jgi:hypothetical protein|tara:strand:- start:192 stop:602 length:411 start_codon:yes stop_codon:yes gene_type:complete